MNKRLPNFTSPIAKFRNKVVQAVLRPFGKLSNRQKFWLGFAFLSILTTFILQNPFRQNVSETYQEGEVLRQSIVSPADISVVNTEETEALKQAAREAIRPIFIYEANRGEQAVQNFRISWEKLHRSSPGTNSNSKANTKTEESLESNWTGSGGTDAAKVLVSRNFSANEIEAITRALRSSSEGSIYNDSDRQYFQNEIELKDRKNPNQQSIVSMPESSMTALSMARAEFREQLNQIRSLSKKEAESFAKALEGFIQPNVVYDSAATNSAREVSAQSIQPIAINLKRGQIIARGGDTVTPNILSQIQAIQMYSTSTRKINRFAGLFVLISGLFWVAWKFIEQRGIATRLTLSPEKTFALFGFVIIIQTLLLSACFLLAEFTAQQNIQPPYIDSSLWSLAIPFAFTSLLITLLADRRTALIAGIFASLLAGMLAPKAIEFILYSTFSGSYLRH